MAVGFKRHVVARLRKTRFSTLPSDSENIYATYTVVYACIGLWRVVQNHYIVISIFLPIKKTRALSENVNKIGSWCLQATINQ